MTKFMLCTVAAAIVALPAIAEAKSKRSSMMSRNSAVYDESLTTGNTRKAPDFQSAAASRLQRGSGQEAGGYARERIRR